MAHTYTSLLTHVVFSTSGRVPLLTDAIRLDVHSYLGGISGNSTPSPSRSVEQPIMFTC